MEGKKWYTSKTIWANLIAAGGLVLNSIYGVNLDSETQVALVTGVLAVVNIVLRFVTKEPVQPIMRKP